MQAATIQAASAHPELMTTDRADVVDRVFELKVTDIYLRHAAMDQPARPTGPRPNVPRNYGPGAVGLLSWFESVESKLSITKCAEGNKYCRKDQVQNLESEFWNHMMIGNEVKYMAQFNELAKMVPHMVSTEEKKVDHYIWGLVHEIIRMVTSSNPITLQAVVGLAYRLTNDVVRSRRRQMVMIVEGRGTRIDKEIETVHLARNCHMGEGNNRRKSACYECGSFDHLRNVCPRLNRAPNKNNNNARNQRAPARGRVYVIRADETRADRSFVSLEFRPLLDQKSEYWLTAVRSEINCLEKVLQIPLEGGEIVFVQGEKPVRDLLIMSAIKMRKYLEKECFAFLAHVLEKDLKVRLFQDILVVRDYP
nr:hypothetical protein [Tanacetum cinerariifolium]